MYWRNNFSEELLSWYTKFCFVLLVLATFSVPGQDTYPWNIYIAFLMLARSKKPASITDFWTSDDHKGLQSKEVTSLTTLCRMKMRDVATLHLLVKTPQVSYYYFLRPGVIFHRCRKKQGSGLYCLNRSQILTKDGGERDGYLLGDWEEGPYWQKYTV